MRSMRSEEDKKYNNELGAVCGEAEYILKNQITPFWLKMKDDNCGGFYGRMNYDLFLYPAADKGVILQSRILWFFSELAMMSHEPEHKEAADHAYSFIADHCFDDEFGGVYWSVTHDGKPADTTKHTYNQAFALYALSSYYRLTGNEDALQAAKQLFDIIENKCRDSGGYLESFDREWNLSVNDKLSENNVIADRTMNTLLHIFEGYANLYRCCPVQWIHDAMIRILEIFRKKVYAPDKQQLNVFFDLDYNELIDLRSYGHDIEASWLLDNGCSLLEGSELTHYISEMDKRLAESIYECAFRDRSVLNECERGIKNTDRIWWVQSEAVLGFINLWEKTSDRCYLSAAEDVMRYIRRYIADTRPGGEWFWGAHANRRPMTEQDIVSEWKCPYHSGRMCLEIIKRSKASA